MCLASQNANGPATLCGLIIGPSAVEVTGDLERGILLP